MTPKEKANFLIDQFSGIVYPYIGSSMLTNDEHEPTIIKNAKMCAYFVVNEIEADHLSNGTTLENSEYWQKVKLEIEIWQKPTT